VGGGLTANQLHMERTEEEKVKEKEKRKKKKKKKDFKSHLVLEVLLINSFGLGVVWGVVGYGLFC